LLPTSRDERCRWLIDRHVPVLEVELGATAKVFKARHRLRIEVTSSDFPRYDRNLNTGGPICTETVGQAALNTVFHDAVRRATWCYPS
jgi:predicted acyl esterase